MLAIDTNVIVRFLTGDDPGQAARARTLIESQDVLASSTVLMEAEWVLRNAYDLDRIAVVQALAAFAGLPRVFVQEPERVAKALDWARTGMDFADALHLAGARECEAFVTFDRRFVKAAAGLEAPSVREL